MGVSSLLTTTNIRSWLLVLLVVGCITRRLYYILPEKQKEKREKEKCIVTVKKWLVKSAYIIILSRPIS